ncbi:hypothetical protein D3C73_1166360 [compost metagenome]
MVIQEHKVCGLTGYIGAAESHGHADIGLTLSGTVVDAVAGLFDQRLHRGTARV